MPGRFRLGDNRPTGAKALQVLEDNSADSRQWEHDAQELRNLLEAAGYTQVAAAHELGFSERSFRAYCSGRESIPPAVLYAMRWVAEHKPNRERWLQVHWKKVGREVKRSDRFEIRSVNELMQVSVNGDVVMRGTLDDLVKKGLVTVHASYSSDRFLWGPSDLRNETKTPHPSSNACPS